MTINTILVKVLRLFLAATFIISAAAKIYSMHFFDGLVAGQLIGADFYDRPTAYFWVQVLTRLIIAGEFMLGVAILQKKYLRKLVLPTMAGLLILFSLQVIYEASFNGKGYVGGNCGCFGEVIPFDNLQTIIKNIILLFMVFFVFKKYKDFKEMTFGPAVPAIMVGLFTFFTMYLTIENLDDAVKTEEYNGSTNLNIGEDVLKTKASFIADFKVGSVGEALQIQENSIVKESASGTKMWFLLPGAVNDSISVEPGQKIEVKYLSEGTFDVALVVNDGFTSDTLIQKGFFNIQASEKEIVPKQNVAIVSRDDSIKKAKSLLLAKKKKEEELRKKQAQEAQLKSNSIFGPYRNGWSDGKYKDLDKGTHLICMFSLTCGHCQAAYRDILAAREKKVVAQPYILAYGGEYDLEPFWRKTGKKSPYILIKKYAEFSSLLKGGGFPRIVVVENGKVVKYWDSNSYSKKSFNKYFGISGKQKTKSEDLIIEDNSIPSLDLGSGQGAAIELE